MPDGIMPFDTKLGLPQNQRVKIENVAYELAYSWNSEDAFVKLKITRVEDGGIVLNHKLVELNPFVARDPGTHEDLFTIMPAALSQEVAEVWVFWG